jgi:hypothetical protein
MFPSSPAPTYSFIVTPEWKTLISQLDGGNEQRRSCWDFPHYNVSLAFDALKPDEFLALWTHYMSCKGAALAFNFWVPVIDTYPEMLYMGIGDGATKTFDIPGKSTSAQTIYVNGQPQGSGFTISYGTGVDGADQVTFTTAPSANYVIACMMTGFLRCRVRYAQDKLSKEEFQYLIYKSTLELMGLGPAT